jgi:integrase/recombinase XerD
MSPLQKQYVGLLTLRGYAQRAHESYIAAVAALAGYYKSLPASLSDEEICGYLMEMHHRGLSFSRINVAVSALRLFYGQVLKRPMDELKELLPRSARVTRRPGVYAREELKRLFVDGCRSVATRTFLRTVYVRPAQARKRNGALCPRQRFRAWIPRAV